MSTQVRVASAEPQSQPRDRNSVNHAPERTTRIRVAMILYRDDLNVGGSLRVVETLAHALDPARVEAHIVFAYGGPGPITARAKVPCHFLDSNGPLDFRGWIRARRFMQELAPDILHFHNPVYWLHGALLGRRYKKLVHAHGPYFVDNMGRLERWLLSQSRRLVDAGVCINREIRQLFLDHGWRREQTWTVFNGIDCADSNILLSKRKARARFDLPEDCLLVGMVCRLAWYKGCQDAIRVLRSLDPKWHLMFCGDGPMLPYLASLARQEGVADRTHFAGMLDEMDPAYAAMDAFLFLSRQEPFGLVIGEAMAARVPVFGLAGEGAYRDSFYPLLTPANSVLIERTSPGDFLSPEPSPVLNELARRINDFGRQPESYRPMIDRAYCWIRERFDSHIQAEAVSDIYDYVMGRVTDSPK